MTTLNPHDILRVWELGEGRDALGRSALLLRSARPDMTADDWASLPLGERDAGLIALHSATFGPTLDAVSDCPRCGDRLEFTLPSSPESAAPSATGPAFPIGDLTVRLRPVTCGDLEAIAGPATAESARRMLLRRCVIEVARGGVPVEPDDWTEDLEAALAARLAECDPMADIELDLTCPSCGHAWREVFDVLTFLWSKLDAKARRLLREVHILARAYGWTEATILDLGERRRRTYLQMADLPDDPLEP